MLSRPATTRAESSGVTPARLAAMVELMADESPAVWASIREELLSLGSLATGVLSRAAKSDDARVRARARRVLAERDRREVVRRLLRRVSKPVSDLESALFALASLDSPSQGRRFDARPYRKAMDAMASQVRLRVAREPRGLAGAWALVHYMSRELGYTGSPDDYHHPDNIHLHRAIERRRGMPLTLTALYMFVARRAGIRAAAVPLPGHVMLRLYGDDDGGADPERSILVDPFCGGKLRTRRECSEFLEGHGRRNAQGAFADAQDGQLFLRHLMNLKNSAQQRGLERQAGELYRVAQALARSHASRLQTTHP